MLVRTIETTVHGRYLLDERGDDLLIGFHGYGESAESHLAELQRIPEIDSWSLAAVQALHPFYVRSSGQVVANWMTSQDRELAIADNIAYVRRVIDALPRRGRLALLGFSQGAQMAVRAAAYAAHADGLILLGGDIPPEIHAEESVRLPPTLLARGLHDEWMTVEKFTKDLNFVERRAAVVTHVFDGGHEWTEEFRTAAGEFLRGLKRSHVA
ncbi:MAG TPA: phospholipase [Thermoanaerobaculia bacterium]|jgi:predicted esterase